VGNLGKHRYIAAIELARQSGAVYQDGSAVID
jgi:hypothetical protein